MVRTGYKSEVMNRIPPGTGPSIAMVTARLVMYGLIVPLTVVVWATVWILSRPGAILMIPLYFLALILVGIVLLIPLVASVIAISMSGLVFIIGGVGSILYLDNPTIGIAAIILGVAVQYELHRRERKRMEERLGYLILKLRPQDGIDQ